MKIRYFSIILSLILFVSCAKQKKERMLKKANVEFHNMKYDDAISAYDAILENYTDYEKAIFNKSIALIKANNSVEAIPLLSQLIEINNKDTAAFYQRAMCYYHEKDYNNSIADFSFLVSGSLYNKNELYFYRGLCYYFLGYYIQTLQDFSNISKGSEYKMDQLYYSALTYEKLQAWDLAIACYEEIIDNHRQDKVILYKLGNCYLNKQKYNKAMYYFSSAVQIDRFFKAARLKIAYIHFKKQNYTDAIVDYTYLIENDSVPPPLALKGRSASYLLQNKLILAEQDINSLLQIDPADKYALSLNNIILQLENKTAFNKPEFYMLVDQELN